MNSFRLFIIFSIALVAFTVMLFGVGFGQTSARALLSHLEGDWEMTGEIMNKPVKYDARGEWTLQNQFLALNMRDVAVPPAYEATLSIGIDSAKKQFVAHWLDSFGGAGARVAGFGPLSNDTIKIFYPYAEGKFLNIFTYNPTKEEWSLLIESEKTKGVWSVFARYSIIRKR